MKNVNQLVEEFVEKLRQTVIYREYLEKRNRVREFLGLQEKINEFRENNMAVLNAGSGEELFDKSDELVEMSEKFRSNPVVDEYLRAELAMVRMIQNVNTQLADAFDLDLYV